MNRQISEIFRHPLREPDEDLLEQARTAPEGDLRAFEKLVLRYQKRVIANCRYLTRDPNNAEDLAQEILIKAFFGMQDFEGKCSFASWLKRIKVNHCLSHLRKHGNRSYVGIEEGEVSRFDELKVPATAERLAGAIGDRALIGEILNSLPETLRVPLILCDMDEMSYEEVANVLAIGLSAVKMRVKRGREQFRERYDKMQTASARKNAV
jgi:RNA polymerase sigma-70 factor (ECF subfamily)